MSERYRQITFSRVRCFRLVLLSYPSPASWFAPTSRWQYTLKGRQSAPSMFLDCGYQRAPSSLGAQERVASQIYLLVQAGFNPVSSSCRSLGVPPSRLSCSHDVRSGVNGRYIKRGEVSMSRVCVRGGA